MPTEEDLIGLGVPPGVATELGNQPQALTATGTSQATAAAIKSKLVTVTGASSQTGVILPSGAKIGSPFYITSIGTTAAKVYAPLSTTLNGSASTTPVTMSAQFASGIFIQVSKGVWVSIPLAP